MRQPNQTAHGAALELSSTAIQSPQTSAAEAPLEPPPAPEGGLQAWVGVFGSFMVFVNIWGFTFVFGVFQSFYEISYIPQQSPSSISWIGTIQSALLVIVGVLAGPLFDLGVYRTMMVVGASLVILGLMMLSLSTNYYQIFLSQGVCVGIGGGLLYVPSLALVSGSFTNKRAIALGIVTCGIGLGGVVYVAAFQRLMPQLGFAWTVRVLGFIALAVFLLSIPALFFSTSGKRRPQSSRRLFDKNALKDSLFLVYSVSSFFIFLGYLVPYFYIPSFAQVVLGTPRSLAFYALAISSATSILGRLGAAVAASYLGVMLPWVFCGLTSGVLCLCWIRIQTLTGFLTFCALYGFFSGALVALPPSIFPRICRDPTLLGTWMGMGWVCSGIAFLVGSPIAGALTKVGQHKHGGRSGDGGLNFLALQLWSGLLLLLGTSCLVLFWALLVKFRGTKILV